MWRFEGRLWGPVELLKLAFKVYKIKFWKLLGTALIPALIAAAAAMIAVVGGVLSVGFGKGNWGVWILFFAVFYLGILILGMWTQMVSIYLLKNPDGDVRVKEAFSKTKGKIFKFFLLSILSYAVMVGSMVPFIIPGLIMAIFMIFAQNVFVTEEASLWGSIRRSREYIRGRFWPVVGRLGFEILLLLPFIILSDKYPILSILSLPLTLLLNVYSYALYRNLAELKGPITDDQLVVGKGKWIAIAVWGIVVILILPLSIVLLAVINPAAQLQKSRDFQKVAPTTNSNLNWAI